MDGIVNVFSFIVSHADEFLTIFGGIVLAASVLAKSFSALIGWLQRGAKYTETSVDDDIFLHAANFSAKLSDWLAALLKVIRPAAIQGAPKTTEPTTEPEPKVT